jgi:hypothetical protein
MNKNLPTRNFRAFTKNKGIFCIEGSWENDHRDKKSVIKALEFLESIENVKSIVKQCPNPLTLEELIRDSMQLRYSKYSILYLAFHGEASFINVGKRGKKVSFEEVSEMIGDRANGRIIHFGCCSTLDISGWDVRRFLIKTKALAVSGYTKKIDFLRSTAFDIMYFQQCQRTHDIRVIKRNMKEYHNKLGRELGFVINHWTKNLK